MQRLMIVVPCYNEEEILPYSIKKLTEVIKDLIKKSKIASNSGILFVNDGSRDKTWEIIQKEYKSNPYVYGLGLAGNVGHQNALFAGLQTAAEICDFSISIDADLQDDIEVIEQMVDEYLAGADIVYSRGQVFHPPGSHGTGTGTGGDSHTSLQDSFPPDGSSSSPCSAG